MKLIARSDSSKTEWIAIEGPHPVLSAITEGINPFFQNRREISRSIRLELPDTFFKKKFEQIHYYGAGCSSPEKKTTLEASLVAQFKAPTTVESDLWAAARGLFIDKPGIACILGIGSNSCLYNGTTITKNIKAAGYILGDEGSFSSLGKLFLSDTLKGLAPKELVEEFYQQTKSDENTVMKNIYDLPFPHRFLATTADFLANHPSNPYIQSLVMLSLRQFFIRNVCQYDYKNYPIRVVGPMASRYTPILIRVAQEFGIDIDRIEESPMKGLVQFHTDQMPILF